MDLNEKAVQLAQRKCAIVCLTRGYDDVRGYHRLIHRNQRVYRTINRNREIQYPLIIWHEGNIPAEHQEYILAHESNADVRFLDISQLFQLPPEMHSTELVENWPLGYRLMCRFHAYHIWHCAAQFEAIMRLDEDCILNRLEFDPFQWLLENELDFATSAYMHEPHELTNRTLAPYVQRYASLVVPALGNVDPYNHSFPYTNIYVTRTAFWLQPKTRHFLAAVAQEPDFIRLRWGDAPVLGLALNLFANPRKVSVIPSLSYYHASHRVHISSAPSVVATVIA